MGGIGKGREQVESRKGPSQYCEGVVSSGKCDRDKHEALGLL